MLPNFARKGFYALYHRESSAARRAADVLSWSFMNGVKALKVPAPYDRTPLCVVSHKYRFVYIGIPKVATRSFRDFFARERGAFGIEMYETRRGFERVLEKYTSYYKFSFVRDPAERALSCYNSKVGPVTLSLLKRARIMSFYEGLESGMAFHDFVLWLNSPEGRDECADRHWMSQYKFLYDEDGNQICDFVGRYENLEADLAAVRQVLGLPEIDLPRSGWVSRGPHEINAQTRDLLKQRYIWDYMLLGYD